MQMNINQFNQMLGKQMTGDEIRAYQVHSLALGALINDAVFEDEYDQINFILDDEVIAQKTKERIPQLYDANNNLNELYLSSFLKQHQLKIDDVIQIINFETRDKYINDAFFKINYPLYFSDKINNFNKNKRKISYVVLPLDRINIKNIIEEYSSNFKIELEKFYNENINQYKSKEKRNVEYCIIDKKLLSINFYPTESEIKEYYKANKELYFQNEKRSFIQFNFKTIEEAEFFKLQNQNFDVLEIIKFAKENNIRFSEFNNLESNEILEEIAVPLFRLNPKEQSEIIETSIAKHIVILQSIQPSIQLELEEVQEDINKTITMIETNNYFNELSNKISEKVLNGESISNIAKNFNLTKEVIENLTQDYSSKDKSKEIIFTNLIPASFSANKDFVSDVIQLNENISFIFNVKDIVLPSPLKFEIVEDKVIHDWKIKKSIEKIKLEVEENINNKTLLSNLSNKYNLNINEISITMNSNELPNNFIANIFQSEKGNNIEVFNDDEFYIGSINDIVMPIEKFDSERSSITKDLRESFAKELRKNKKISMNDNLINALINQY